MSSLNKAFLELALRPARRYLSKEQEASLTLTSGTPKDTETFVEITPPDGYMFAIRYFKLTTPLEAKANMLVTGLVGEEVRLLKDDQSENLTDMLYDASDWSPRFFFLRKFRLYAITTSVTTADRVVMLKYSGSLVPK